MRIKLYSKVPGSIKNWINLKPLKIIKTVTIELFYIQLAFV
jgi:hypothetical protein